MLVGNKIDLCEESPQLRQVSTDEAQKLADNYKLMFFEASAVQDVNVRTAFEELLQSNCYNIT